MKNLYNALLLEDRIVLTGVGVYLVLVAMASGVSIAGNAALWIAGCAVLGWYLQRHAEGPNPLQREAGHETKTRRRTDGFEAS